MLFEIHKDCRHFRGDFPCQYHCPCSGCANYDPVGRRVLIVMLIKLGDMLIASPLPKALKDQNPSTHITWLADKSCVPLLKLNPWIDEVIEFNWESVNALEQCYFDLVLGFERNRAAAALVGKVRAKEKRGLAFGGEDNTLYPLCERSEYFFKLNLWNDFRTRINEETWTEFYFALAGFCYSDQPYQLKLPQAAIDAAHEIIKALPQQRRTYIIFNFGGSFSYKIWPVERWLELARAVALWNFGVVITFGPSERGMVETFRRELPSDLCTLFITPDTSNDIALLAALYQSAAAVVTGDTLGMHLALWAQKPAVALFGPSNPAEVVPRKQKHLHVIRSNYSCSPCAHHVTCNGIGGCMGNISNAQVIEKLRAVL